MIGEYDAEQKALEQEIADLQKQIDSYAADSVRADKFIDLVRRYTGFEELTPSMLGEFIEKVVVHEGDKSSGKRIQKLEIHMNFIGNFEVPQETVATTPEELEAQEKLDEQRAKNRERQRKYRERKKEETAAKSESSNESTSAA